MNERIRVFKEEPGFIKLFKLFREKYRSIGRVGGNVRIKDFSDVEIEAIAGFLGRSSRELKEKGSLALLEFERELIHTGFSDYTLLKLLEEILQEPVFSKKEEAERSLQQENDFIESLRKEIPEAEWWLDWIKVKGPDTRWIWSLYKQEQEVLYGMLTTVYKAVKSLPSEGDFERLPFFAQRTTGNPHYFDIGGTPAKLLIHCLYVDQAVKGQVGLSFPRGVEETTDLLAEYGLMRDDLWNFVTVQGLVASNKGGIHPVWEAAVQTQSVMNVPMKELAKLDRVWPSLGSTVWIVENSSVASTIMDAVPDSPIICTHGQLRAASWRLLDKLVESNCTLRYSGDLDPEGVVIAERLKRRYQKHLVLWRMDKHAYELSLSNEEITERLVKLDSISSPEWEEVISMMKEIKKSGYQEALVAELINDIRKSLSY